MARIKYLIQEELLHLIKESFNIDDLFENQNDLEHRMIDDFLNYNNADFTKEISWKVVPFNRLKKIWEDHLKYGVVRDEKGFEMVKNIIINNILKVDIISTISGHKSYGSETFDEMLNDYVDNQLDCLIEHKKIDYSQYEIPFEQPEKGYKIKEPVDEPSPCVVEVNPYVKSVFDKNYDKEANNRERIKDILIEDLTEKFLWYYTDSENMGGFKSDYGLEPLLKLLRELSNTEGTEKELIVLDKILNVVHQRSDIARWFVEGGSSSLSSLSGYGDDEGESKISGKYRMSDYS